MTSFILVCAGGAAGTAARYLTALWAGAAFGPAFPLGTLIVNVPGAHLLRRVRQVETPAARDRVAGAPAPRRLRRRDRVPRRGRLRREQRHSHHASAGDVVGPADRDRSRRYRGAGGSAPADPRRDA